MFLLRLPKKCPLRCEHCFEWHVLNVRKPHYDRYQKHCGEISGEGQPMDNVKMHPDFPQEEEFAMSSLTLFSYYQTLFFPNKMLRFFTSYALMEDVSINKWEREYLYFLKKVSYCNRGRQLLLKNPVNTVRIRCLLKLFAQAKFIYIHRSKEAVLRWSYKLYAELLRINTFQALPALPPKETINKYLQRNVTAV